MGLCRIFNQAVILEHRHFTDNRALPKKKGFRLEHWKPFAAYFLDWLLASVMFRHRINPIPSA
jgi:hypothetical protein